MNVERLRAEWREFKGEIKERWGLLPDDELDRIRGEEELLVGLLQKHYGLTRQQAERDVDSFFGKV
jgi:uncharacterized protein YjbJ (UPF0337 family)